MKKCIKISLILLSIFLALTIGVIIFYLITTLNAKLNSNLLNENKSNIQYFYNDNEEISLSSNDGNYVKIDSLEPYIYNSFVAIEDQRFYSHNGIDTRGILRATLKNISTFSFKEGASTITQQLIKNTHLSNDKTIKRKMQEIKLSFDIEKKYSKKEILEMYINSIYFGKNCYGITSASKKYFNKLPQDLTINESATLAGIVKAPSKYSKDENNEILFNRKNVVLKKMLEQGYITNDEYTANINKEVSLGKNVVKKYITSFDLAQNEVEKIVEKSPYKYKELKVYTTIDKNMQSLIENELNNDNTDSNKSLSLLGKNNKIIAYASTIGEVKRSLGSTIKPLLVYAPAIEENNILPCTIIKDEKIDYNGYSPKNYKNIYYGDVSARFSLSKSLNSVAVKILNENGIEKSINYLKNTNLEFTENDNNLSIALGSTEKGATLLEIASAYSIFRENGKYNNYIVIDRIVDKNGITIYKNNNISKKVFSEDTCELMNDMLYDCVKNGTAKKLSFCETKLYAKTGTNGSENGNLDAYTISYNPEYTLGVLFSNKEGSLLSNNITGGSAPATLSLNIWNSIYKDKEKPNDFENNYTVKREIDSEELNNGKILLAGEEYPEKEKVNEIFKKSKTPTNISKRFSSPKVENANISVNCNKISIQLCLTKYISADIYRENNGKKIKVGNVKYNNREISFLDKDIKPNNVYTYSIIPYYKKEDKIYYGEEIFLDKIKTSGIPDDLFDDLI